MLIRLLVDRTGPNPRFNPLLPPGKDNPHTISLPKGTEIEASDEDAAILLSLQVPADPDYEPEGHPSATMPIVELVPPIADATSNDATTDAA